MILHELATNATKYGALSAADGVVDIRWLATPLGWSLSWRERGGPPVIPSERKGFGSRLMNSLARQLNGAIVVDWAREGLNMELRVANGRPAP